MGAALNVAANKESLDLPCSALSTVDNPAAGVYVYRLQARISGSISGGPHEVAVEFAKLVAIAL
jgi:hypothetical protein